MQSYTCRQKTHYTHKFQVPLTTTSSNTNMGFRTLPLPPSQNALLIAPKHSHCYSYCAISPSKRAAVNVTCCAKKQNDADEEPKKRKQNLFESVTEALDFAQVRSAKDAELLDEAREQTKSGERMSREQYGALRRKIGGTYKDFFKSYVEVDGEYVEEGWVDKTCKVCRKDTKGEPRQVDKLGRYVHLACLDKPTSGNFFTRLFSG